jgi:hypothetical protein
MRRILLTALIAVFMTGCATTSPKKPIPMQPKVTSPATMSELEQGKRLFQDGYYKRAMEQLLPLAAEGNIEAQYAVGYMYYYGFGAPQDTESGYFWIKRSADQHYQPAIHALMIMDQEKRKHGKPRF